MAITNFNSRPPQITAPFVALLLFTLLLLSGIIVVTMQEMDKNSRLEKNLSIHEVISAEINSVRSGTQAYANWDEAVKNFAVQFNPEWIKSNFDEVIPGEQNIEYFMIYNPDNQLIHQYPSANVDHTLLENVHKTISDFRDKTADDIEQTLAGTIVNEDGSIDIIAIRRITPIDKSIPESFRQHILVFASEIKGEKAEKIKIRMGVTDIMGSKILPHDTERFVPLTDIFDDKAGYLVWDKPKPSEAFIRMAAVPLTIAIVVLAILTNLILQRQQQAIDSIVKRDNVIHLLAAGVSASHTPIMILSLHEKTDRLSIAYANSAACNLYGMASDAIIGADLSAFESKDTYETHRNLRIDIQTQKKNGSLEILHKKKDGVTFWNEVTLSPITTDKNEFLGFVVLMKDVSEERRLRETTAMRDRVLSLGQLAGSVAHELNNLLQPALTYGELLRSQEKFHDALSQEALGAIVSSCTHATQIIRNVLNFSRQGEIQRSKMKLADAIKRALDMVRPLMPSTLTIQVGDLSRANGLAVINDNQMSQLLSQLLLNASWATNKCGSVGIHLRRPSNVESIATRFALPAADYVEMIVADNGIGMEEQIRVRALEPFFTTKPVGQGTGLGLSTVDSIVKSWGGAIDIESETGKGTVVHIYIPLATEA